MVDLGIKIKKKIYNFELKKKYQPLRHFKVKERPPIQIIKDQIHKLFSPKKVEKKKTTQQTAPQKGGFNFVVFGAFILIALIIVAIGWLYLTTSVFQSGANVFQPQFEKPSIQNNIKGGDLVTSGSRNDPKHIAAVSVQYNTTNLQNYTVSLSTYKDKIPSEVFVLQSERFEATTYPDFIRTLRSNLGKRKIIVNEISMKQLETLPQGAIVLVSSGAIPKEILGFDSTLSMNKLADRGVVVIYMGQPFTKMLNGTLVFSTPKEITSTLPVKFDESSPLESKDGFNLFQPLYRVNSLGGWSSSIVYGSVSIVKKGSGAFIFIPQTLDGGWRSNYTSAADDISRIIFETPWAEPDGPPKVYEFTNQSSYFGSSYFFTNPYDHPNVTVKVEFVGYSSTSIFPIRETLFTRFETKSQNGLFIDPSGTIVATNITNKPVRMNAQLHESAAAQPNMFLIILDSNGTEIENFPQGNVNVQSDRSFDLQIFVDKGEYLVKLIDDESKTYAETYMQVVSPDFKYQGIDNKKHSIYIFDITMAGSPFKLNDITVKVDNGQFGTYKFNDVDRILVDLGSYTGGESLPTGKHKFEFTAGGLKLSVPVDHTRAPTIFENPLFWIVIILTGGIVGVGILFARQESVYYSVDIPDFPPIARTKIPLSVDVVVSVFQKVNENYRWQNTPLTTSEIKNGFKDIFYQGKPIYITDYNVEYLLEDMEKKNLVKESLTYYGLSAWENKSKRTIEYLALMRRLRDICVNNAIPFTSIGESNEADSIITVVGQQMSIHFYERTLNLKSLLEKLLPNLGHGISIILFKNIAEKQHFESLINSSPSIAPLIVKMEAETNSLLFLTTEELEKMLLEFKSM